MNNLPTPLKLILIALAIPAIGYAVSHFILADINGDLNSVGLPDAEIICGLGHSSSLRDDTLEELDEACKEIRYVKLLGKASIVAAIIAVIVPLGYWITAFVCGTKRKRIALLFPPVLRLSLFLFAISVLLQGAILTYGLYVAESYLTGRVHFFLIGLIGIGALLGALSLIVTAFEFGSKLRINVLGKLLSADNSKSLTAFVSQIADKLGANPPRNIIVGLEPNFYVTNCRIQVPGHEQEIVGETLYISAPLARVLTKAEFASVIGHELGHFRGKDTFYSMRFAPVYAGLSDALKAVDDSSIVTLPVAETLSHMQEVFSANISKISRDREFEADKAGAEASSPLSLSTALLKLAMYSEVWGSVRKQNIERLKQGKVANNLSVVFRDAAKYDIEVDAKEKIVEEALASEIYHPTDSHPPIVSRLSELGIDVAGITDDMTLVPEESAIDLIDNALVLEQEITLLEHKLVVSLGLVQRFPDRTNNQVLHATYALAAKMVLADKKIDSNEITIAEEMGSELFEDFDPVEFRGYCNSPEQVSNVEELAGALKTVLSEAEMHLIVKYLQAISKSDGESSAQEKEMLQQVASGFDIPLAGSKTENPGRNSEPNA